MQLVLSKRILFFISLIFSLFFIQAHATPSGAWDEALPEEMGIAPEKVDKLFDLSFRDDATQSVVLIKDGVLIAEQ